MARAIPAIKIEREKKGTQSMKLELKIETIRNQIGEMTTNVRPYMEIRRDLVIMIIGLGWL
jgi:hypothetical protein